MNILTKIIFILTVLLCYSNAQECVLIIQGTGDPNTSAHFFITAQGENKAYLEVDKIVVEAGASLVVWHPDALSGAEISGDGNVVYVGPDVYAILKFFGKNIVKHI